MKEHIITAVLLSSIQSIAVTAVIGTARIAFILFSFFLLRIIELTFGLDLLAMGIVDVPICMFEWFVTNGPLVRFVVLGDVTKLTAAPVVASPASVTSTLVLSTCNRFRNVTNSLLRLFKRCCKWTASFVDEASAIARKKSPIKRYENIRCNSKIRNGWSFR